MKVNIPKLLRRTRRERLKKEGKLNTFRNKEHTPRTAYKRNKRIEYD